jgi:hypothetical protein
MVDRDDEIAELKRRLAALESGEAVGAPDVPAESGIAAPPAAPSSAPGPLVVKPKPPGNKAGLIFIAVCALLILVGVAVAPKPASVIPAAQISPVPPSSSGEVIHPTQAELDAEVSQPQYLWRYVETDDEMGRGKVRAACVTSTNQVSLTWPYKAQDTEFCLRRGGRHGFDSYLRLTDSGQYICRSYSGCRVHIRFDDGSAQSYEAEEASDGSSEIIFMPAASKISAALTTAKRMRIEAEYYQAGLQTSEFDVAGYDFSRLGASVPKGKKRR